MIGIDVNITIKGGNTYLELPVIPEALNYVDGATTPISVDIIDVGSVAFSNGVELDSLAWSSFFPARYDPAYCTTATLKTPIQYRNLFSTWKDEGTELQVIIPAAGITKAMKIQTFTWDFKGFEGDIYYQVTFQEQKRLLPIRVAATVIEAPTPEREALPAGTNITKGDVVAFAGGNVYISANAANPSSTRSGATCDCTLTYSGKHPYHLITQKGKGDLVYGWVDAANCTKL